MYSKNIFRDTYTIITGSFSSNKFGGVLMISDILQAYNKYGKQVAYLGVSKDQDGILLLSDRYGDTGWGKSGKK